jgi:hypothetical protein
VAAANRALHPNQLRKAETCVAITIVPKQIARQGSLHSISLPTIVRQLNEQLNGVGIARAIGGFDFSFNIGASGRFWQPHLYLLAVTRDWKQLRTNLSEVFHPTFFVCRPTRLRPFDGSYRGISYGCKWRFFRRVSFVGRDGGTHVVNRRLSASEKKELFVFLDRIGLERRIVLGGYRTSLSSRSPRFCECHDSILQNLTTLSEDVTIRSG